VTPVISPTGVGRRYGSHYALAGVTAGGFATIRRLAV
jgi:hypothetical protein